MLTDLLAWSVAIASLGLYMSAFFLPELYRKFDLVSSGAGLFFALTLWIYGDRIRGGLLLGETAAVVLLLWFGWQTVQYRWQLTHERDRTDTQKAQTLWSKLRSVLPGSKPENDGAPPKVAGKIAEFLGGINLDKIKGQFQKGDNAQKIAPEIVKDDSPSESEGKGESAIAADITTASGTDEPSLDVTPDPSLESDAWGSDSEAVPESTTVAAAEPSPETKSTPEITPEVPTPQSITDPVPAIATPDSEPVSDPGDPAHPSEHHAADEPSEIVGIADVVIEIPESSDDEEEFGEGSEDNPKIAAELDSAPANLEDQGSPESLEEKQSPDWPPPEPID